MDVLISSSIFSYVSVACLSLSFVLSMYFLFFLFFLETDIIQIKQYTFRKGVSH